MSCGAHTAPGVVVLQPNARPGDTTRCIVSGAAFRVSEKTIRRMYRDVTVFLCCESCARYFDDHAEAVLAVRRMTPAA
jgi:hypothetical protein